MRLHTKNGYKVPAVSDSAESIDLSSTDYTNAEPFTVFVGTGGDIKVEMIHSGIVTFKNIPDGTPMPRLFKKVFKTGTTATDLIAEF